MIVHTILQIHFNTGPAGLGLDSRSQECKKANLSAQIILQSFQSVWMEFGVLLSHVCVMNLILNLFRPFSYSSQG